MSNSLPADNHVHSEWSYDAPRGSMLRTCEKAVQIGLPALAFTEHVDFTDWATSRPFDVDGYLACLHECRDRFGELKILSGVELGEPHIFPFEEKARFDRVLGSLHALGDSHRLVAADDLFSTVDAREVMHRYFAELHTLVSTSDTFEVLAHVDYPRRYWPASARPYTEDEFEPEYRAVFRALADSSRVLEFNTTTPLASVRLLSWWREEGGTAVSFGSDAHEPAGLARDFRAAMAIASAAGFRTTDDPVGFWGR